MIDLHHHLLWGLDDGASSVETALEMARIAAEDGITHVVCSPHANGRYAYDPEIVAAKIRELEQLLAAEQVNLKLGRGCDFHLSYDNIEQAKADPARYSINGRGYLLVELPDYGVPPNVAEVFYDLQVAGLTPILTHPERNPTLQADRRRMIEWLERGLLVQVTAGSVLGQMGRQAEKMAHELLEKRWVHFLATDAHNTSSRPPRMSAAHDLVAKKYGPDYARLLCFSNPLAAFQGRPLEPQPEALGLYQELEPKRWWQRLLSR